MKVLVGGDPLASAKLTVKDGSADNNGNKGGAAAQNAQKSAQVLASTGAAVTAIVAVALAFVSFGMLALAARRRKDEE
ncbi:hypothetical protein [Aeriscardovia aeriphila]|uniref:Uncharacterized protein n=1 Tax=Aeriscardovia aeriphila TaxID=218139 RepID=A0A261F7Y7_9BIFI|nr:hypothetical protein [Aeriscardovia aeriphila]NYI25066.1 hypothetical protein [Aeriscardovia aeriphila]OZG55143.1 hypothetical protein AEAE_1267 [Aeriscardovia aeriphila]